MKTANSTSRGAFTLVEALVAAAFNDAVCRAEEVSAAEMGKLTAGMPLPPGMKSPF